MKVINFSDPECAKQVTVTLWQSTTGSLFKTEESARYDSCTHRPCQKCGEPANKFRTLCDKCSAAAEVEAYKSLPSKPYGGEPIYSEAFDKFFFDGDEIECFLEEEEEEVSVDNLMFVHCKPKLLRTFDYESTYCDELPEDTYLNDIWPELAKLFEDANELIRKEKRVVSWYPDKVRVDIDSLKEALSHIH